MQSPPEQGGHKTIVFKKREYAGESKFQRIESSYCIEKRFEMENIQNFLDGEITLKEKTKCSRESWQ